MSSKKQIGSRSASPLSVVWAASPAQEAVQQQGRFSNDILTNSFVTRVRDLWAMTNPCCALKKCFCKKRSCLEESGSAVLSAASRAAGLKSQRKIPEGCQMEGLVARAVTMIFWPVPCAGGNRKLRELLLRGRQEQDEGTQQ